MDRQRAILHVDMNNFYASVECLYDPALRGKPVAVGGSVEERHGIILAKNQLAKAAGVRTGEALWQARQKCPALIMLPPNYGRYLRFSRLARDIYEDYTDQIEPFGLDECWLDVTGSRAAFGDGVHIAQVIRKRVREELGVTVSVGVSYNKVFAKLGSDMKKPDAVTVLTPENYKERVWPLPAQDLLYVGPATRRKLQRRGITTIGGVARMDPALLQGWLGKWGLVLHRFANGEDHSPVRRMDQRSVIKSVGNSTTTPRDIVNREDARIVFTVLADSVAARLREYGFRAALLQISLRDSGLNSFERQAQLRQPTNLSGELFQGAMALFEDNWQGQPLRSVGLRAAMLQAEGAPVQMSLFDGAVERLRREEELERTIDDLRRRFGHRSVLKGALYEDPKLGMINPKGDHTIHPVGFFL